MAALGEAFIRAASLFKILELNAHQKRAIQAIVVDKKDVCGEERCVTTLKTAV